MYPTSRDLIEKIILAIDQTILPAVEEKQAASSLRSSRTLLMHLARRVDEEPDILIADNEDAKVTLKTLINENPAHPACRMLAAGLQIPPGTDEKLLKRLRASNEQFQQAIDATLRALPLAGQETPAESAIRSTLRRYLRRHIEREREMIMGAFLGSPF